MTREPLTIGDPTRRLSLGAGLLMLGLVAGVLIGVRYAFSWVVDHSDEWSLASAQRVVADSSLPAPSKAALKADLERLGAAHAAGKIDYDGLFGTLQRVIEGPYVPAGELDAAAAAPDLPEPARVTFRRAATSLATHEWVPKPVLELCEALRAGTPVASLEARAAEFLAAETAAPAEAAPGFDVVTTFRALVDATLAGNPPKRYPAR